MALAWRVRAVSFITLGQSNTCVWRVRAPHLALAHGRLSARWPWRVRAVSVGALGPTTGRSARPRPSDRAFANPLRHAFGPPFGRAPAPLPWHTRATAPAPLNRTHSLSLSFLLSFLIFSQILSSSNLSYSHTTTHTFLFCVISLAPCREEESKLPMIRPLLRGCEPLGTQTEGDKMISLTNDSIISYILTGGKDWNIGILYMKKLSA
ncbi:hypothetical protein PIB30_035718 [Stylosanthes scabra]|uniref:Uncharacterized protein n=1 Tax=Stylosanthes scabra TaxID=79078 RepID=A0ABU6YAF2_9FABA|nr:hypothetical protein [Stylosanthes scabra]